jgi:hypothetical protein
MRYLILTYYRKSTGKIDEVMSVTKNLKRNDLQTASIILDFKEQKVVLASVDRQQMPKDWNKIVSYYYEHYSATIERLFVENGHPLNLITQQTNAPDTVPQSG